jgi:CheY-like chemotaxis protein
MENDWKGIKILIVEDDKSSLMFFKLAIKQTGATILTAVNGEQAIETVKNNKDIDVIIMDIHMPKMNGLEATRIIKNINSKIGIIIQTAYVLEHTKEECYEAGSDIFIEKPMSLITLISSINDLLNKK